MVRYGESALQPKSLGVLQALTFRCSSSQQHVARLAQVPFSPMKVAVHVPSVLCQSPCSIWRVACRTKSEGMTTA